MLQWMMKETKKVLFFLQVFRPFDATLRHTPLYRRLMMHFRAKTKPWVQRNRLQSSETGLLYGTDLGKATKISHALKNLKSKVASIFSDGRSPAKLSNRGWRVFVREKTKNLMVSLTELQRSCVEMGQSSRSPPPIWALRQSSTCLSSVQNTWKSAPEGLPDCSLMNTRLASFLNIPVYLLSNTALNNRLFVGGGVLSTPSVLFWALNQAKLNDKVLVAVYASVQC